MLVITFLQWWYGPGWRDAARRIVDRIGHIYLDFSVPILLRTLFSPWRRIVTPRGGSIDQQARAMVDNLVSRIVGFFVRSLALFVALLFITITVVAGGLVILLWPLAPGLALALIAGGFIL